MANDCHLWSGRRSMDTGHHPCHEGGTEAWRPDGCGSTPITQHSRRCAPFGGYKNSGIGRETDLSILDAYTQKKNIFINLNTAPSGFYPA